MTTASAAPALSPTTVPPSTTEASGNSSPSIAEQITPLGSARLSSVADESRRPEAISIGAIGVELAPVVSVGVTDTGEYEVPGADAVGWYEFGPAPGETGSAVLAAHIAFNGSDGVFRYLDELELGETFTIDFDDGSSTTWVISEQAQYGKTELPFDRIFNRSGAPTVALITCGGSFNTAARSYDDNVVAYAVPIATT